MTPNDGETNGPVGSASVGPLDDGFCLDGLSFDGANDFIEVPYNAQLHLANSDYTFEWWVLLDGSNGGSTVSTRSSSGYNIASRSAGPYTTAGCCSGGNPMYFNDINSDWWTPTNISTGWHHLAVTHDSLAGRV